MKIYAYEVRQDEMGYFKEYEKKYGVSVVLNHQVPTLENADNVDGCIGVTILGQGDINAKLLNKWYDLGTRYVSSRTIGLNHIDLEHAKEIGIQVCNAKYPPNGVAEFALMLLLMCMRNYKQALWRGQVNDYSLSGLQGKELHDLTVGVMGTGNIGRTFVQLLSGFGCRILAYDLHENEDVKKYATYVDKDTLLKESDFLSLHCPLSDLSRNFIDKEAFRKMKKTAVLINVARGPVVNNSDLYEALVAGEIQAAGLDVLEKEPLELSNPLSTLKDSNKLIITPHLAWASVEARTRCVQGVYENIKAFMRGENRNVVNL